LLKKQQKTLGGYFFCRTQYIRDRQSFTHAKSYGLRVLTKNKNQG